MADLLRCPFHDLDRLFEARHGNIDDLIPLQGYPAYARRNVETYCEVPPSALAVLAISSGFYVPRRRSSAAADHSAIDRNAVVDRCSTAITSSVVWENVGHTN